MQTQQRVKKKAAASLQATGGPQKKSAKQAIKAAGETLAEQVDMHAHLALVRITARTPAHVEARA
jgi:hypothetical protein